MFCSLFVNKCGFDDIILDDILGDRIIFGIVDNKVRERFLWEFEFDFDKIFDICFVVEMF